MNRASTGKQVSKPPMKPVKAKKPMKGKKPYAMAKGGKVC